MVSVPLHVVLPQNVTLHGLLEPGSVEPTVETPLSQNVIPHGLLEPGSVEPTVETPVSPRVSQEEEERKKIINGQYKCFEKMNRDQPYNKSGSDNVHYFNTQCVGLFQIINWVD